MSRNKALLTLAVTATAVIFGTAVGGWPSVTGAPSAAQSIVGSWVVIPAGLPGRPPGTPSVISFTSDGNVTLLSPFDSGSLGGWTRTGDRTLTYTLITLRRNAVGDFIGTSKARVKVTLAATYDEWTGSGKSDRLDDQGKVVQSFDITNHATRIKVESPLMSV